MYGARFELEPPVEFGFTPSTCERLQLDRAVMDPRNNVHDFAVLAARLSSNPETREQILAEHGLEEASWEQVEQVWHDRMSDEENRHSGDTIPELTRQYAEAFATAMAAGQHLSFPQYLEITGELRRGIDATEALKRKGVSLATYLESHARFTRAMVSDPSLARAFEQEMAVPARKRGQE